MQGCTVQLERRVVSPPTPAKVRLVVKGAPVTAGTWLSFHENQHHANSPRHDRDCRRHRFVFHPIVRTERRYPGCGDASSGFRYDSGSGCCRSARANADRGHDDDRRSTCAASGRYACPTQDDAGPDDRRPLAARAGSRSQCSAGCRGPPFRKPGSRRRDAGRAGASGPARSRTGCGAGRRSARDC